MLRDHSPIVIDKFNGLWSNGDAEVCPPDHFLEAKNIQFFNQGFGPRDPLDVYQNPELALDKVLRVYTYVMQNSESLLVLVEGGSIFHVIDAATVYGPILTIANMTDFGLVSIAGRAYITPMSADTGLANEFMYVYKGDGTYSRKAAGFPPTNGGLAPLIAYNTNDTGVVDAGTHVIAVAFMNSNIGLLGPEVFAVVKAPGAKQIQLTNIPIGPSGTISRIIAMTKVISTSIITSTVNKTYSWAADLEGWFNSGTSPITFGYDSTDHAVKFTGTVTPDATETGRAYSAGSITWENLGVPVGATVVSLKVASFNRKVVNRTNVVSAGLSLQALNASGVNIIDSTLLYSAAMPTVVDSVYTAMSAGAVHMVSSAYGGSGTAIKFLLTLDATTSSGSATPDYRYDDLVITITYNREIASLYGGDQTAYSYYDAMTVMDNVTTSVKINIADASLTLAHTPGATPPAAPTSSAILVQQNDLAGYCDSGFHLIGVVYETDTGFLTALGPEYFGGQTFIDPTKQIKITNIPISTNPAVVKRHLVSTIAITGYNGNQAGYSYYFIPNATLNNNTTTELLISYFDFDLVNDATHLADNFSEIPAFAGLTTYQGRLVGYGEHDNVSVARLSAAGEPEAISQVDGLIIAPLDGNPLTNAQEFRNTLYLFKQTKTIAYADNGDVPASWIPNIIDQGAGASIHGIAKVLDSGGVNVDFLIIANLSGIMLFNGLFIRPELSWKISDLWSSLSKTEYHHIQMVNNSTSKKAWVTLPSPYQNMLLHFDYVNGLDPRNVRYSLWEFSREVHGITLIDSGKLILGMPYLSRSIFDPAIFDPVIFG